MTGCLQTIKRKGCGKK